MSYKQPISELFYNIMHYGNSASIVNDASIKPDLNLFEALITPILESEELSFRALDEVQQWTDNGDTLVRDLVLQFMARLSTSGFGELRIASNAAIPTMLANGREFIVFASHYLRRHKPTKSLYGIFSALFRRKPTSEVLEWWDGAKRASNVSAKDVFHKLRPKPATPEEEALFGFIIGNATIDYTKIPDRFRLGTVLDALSPGVGTNDTVVMELVCSYGLRLKDLPSGYRERNTLWPLYLELGMYEEIPVSGYMHMAKTFKGEARDNYLDVLLNKLPILKLGGKIPSLARALMTFKDCHAIIDTWARRIRANMADGKQRAIFLSTDGGTNESRWLSYVLHDKKSKSTNIVFNHKTFNVIDMSTLGFVAYSELLRQVPEEDSRALIPFDLLLSDKTNKFDQTFVFTGKDTPVEAKSKITDYWTARQHPLEVCFVGTNIAPNYSIVDETNLGVTFNTLNGAHYDKFLDRFAS